MELTLVTAFLPLEDLSLNKEIQRHTKRNKTTNTTGTIKTKNFGLVLPQLLAQATIKTKQATLVSSQWSSQLPCKKLLHNVSIKRINVFHKRIQMKRSNSNRIKKRKRSNLITKDRSNIHIKWSIKTKDSLNTTIVKLQFVQKSQLLTQIWKIPL